MKAVTICSPVKDKANEVPSLSSSVSTKSPTTITKPVFTSTTTKNLKRSTSNSNNNVGVCSVKFESVPYPRQHPLYGLPRLRPFVVCPNNEKPIPLTFPKET